ncbi:MAG: hypothetical protein EXR91_05675 [Gemmatimonadetes bacterium]|nr:hypothetical protein [Gemmatimonadota bacterium]
MRPCVRYAWLLFALAASACELEELTVIDFVDIVVAEVYVTLGDAPAEHRVRALLHGTAAGGTPDGETFDEALVRITRADGFTIDLALDLITECVDSVPVGASGSCFVDGGQAAGLAPGDALELSVGLADGRTLLAASLIPGDFQLDGISVSCRLVPESLLPLLWSRSDGAWAYVNETLISGLRAALAPEGIAVEDDPLYLLGLSISAADTTVMFPSEFGVFDRFDLDQDLAVRLQQGLPDGTDALVSVTAVDRNYTNWVRGGNFNPSGQVRVASVRGDGTGVFGAAVVREFAVISSATPGGPPDCPIP